MPGPFIGPKKSVETWNWLGRPRRAVHYGKAWRHHPRWGTLRSSAWIALTAPAL